MTDFNGYNRHFPEEPKIKAYEQHTASIRKDGVIALSQKANKDLDLQDYKYYVLFFNPNSDSQYGEKVAILFTNDPGELGVIHRRKMGVVELHAASFLAKNMISMTSDTNRCGIPVESTSIGSLEGGGIKIEFSVEALIINAE